MSSLNPFQEELGMKGETSEFREDWRAKTMPQLHVTAAHWLDLAVSRQQHYFASFDPLCTCALAAIFYRLSSHASVRIFNLFSIHMPLPVSVIYTRLCLCLLSIIYTSLPLTVICYLHKTLPVSFIYYLHMSLPLSVICYLHKSLPLSVICYLHKSLPLVKLYIVWWMQKNLKNWDNLSAFFTHYDEFEFCVPVVILYVSGISKSFLSFNSSSFSPSYWLPTWRTCFR